MKKTHIIGIVLAVLILAGGVAAFLWTGNAVRARKPPRRRYMTNTGSFAPMLSRAN